MKKSLIALAALAAVGGVSAQSTVELYGRLDLGHANISTETTTAGVITGKVKRTSLAGEQNGRTTSRLGFKGTEDLGGGLKADFNYELGMSIDNSPAAIMATRLANIGLTGGFGTLRIGTFLNSFDSVRGMSPATYSTPGGDFLANHIGAVAGALALSDTNAVAAFGGFTPTTVFNGTTTGTAQVALLTVTGTSNLFGLTTAQVALIKAHAEGGTAITVNSATGATIDATDATALTAVTGALGVTGGGVTRQQSEQLLARYNAQVAAARATNLAQATELKALMGNGLGARSQNAISYTSPDFGGFRVAVGLSADQSKEDAAGVKVADNKVDGQSFTLSYAAGPLNAMAVVGTGTLTTKSKASSATSFAGAGSAVGESKAKYSDQAFGATYNLGFMIASVQHERTKGELQMFRGTAISGSNIETSASELGAKFPMGAFTPYVTVGSGKITTAAAGVSTGKSDTSSMQVGSTYDLSKRSFLYAAYGNLTVKNKAAANKIDTDGYKFGLVHQF